MVPLPKYKELIVSGVKCMIIAHIPTLSGAAWNEFTLIKQNRMTEIATQNRLPLIALVQSVLNSFYLANHRLEYFSPNNSKYSIKQVKFSKILHSVPQQEHHPVQSYLAHQLQEVHTNLVSPRITTKLIIGMSDYTIFVKDQAQVFLGGPPLVKMATGEIVESETLGGAAMHSSKSGLSDFLAPDEFSGILAARRWVRSINPLRMESPNQKAIAPKYDVEDLLGIVGTDIRKGVMPMGEIVARIVDASRFEIFKPLYGKNMLCCWAYIHGTQLHTRD